MDIRERLDPPPGLTGRIGGLHLKRRTREGRQGFDLILSVGYACQNGDDEERRYRFWNHLQRIQSKGGARTQHTSAIDGNAHVGTDEAPDTVPMIGTAGREYTNEQGQQMLQTCEALGMRAVNTFTASQLNAHAIYAGPTHWNTNGMHRLDYWLASPSIGVLGLWGDHKLTSRWQYGTKRVHLLRSASEKFVFTVFGSFSPSARP